MKTRYHREITVQALGPYFHPLALEEVIHANLGQDAWYYQLGHDRYHFDNNSFVAGDQYCEEQRQLVITNLTNGMISKARQAMGRLTHTVQDFYAHSNYVDLWRARFPDSPAKDIDPLDAEILRSALLRSGKIVYPLEALSFIDIFKPLVLPLLPKDSHAGMNIDDPSRNNFDWAFNASVNRTVKEYSNLSQKMTQEEIFCLTGLTQAAEKKNLIT